jgi:hypothetical protein
VSRRTISALAIALAATLALAAVAPAARGPKDPTYQPNARDLAIARSLLLVRAVVPARFTIESSKPSDDDFTCSTYDPDLSRLVSTADVEGRDFSHTARTGVYFVSSTAMLFRTSEEAATYWRRAVVHRKVGPCLVESFRDAFGKGAALGNVKVIPLELASGELSVQSWNVVGDLRDGTRVLGKALIEVAVLKRGRAISALMMFTLGKPLGADAEAMGAAVGHKLARAAVTGGPAA